MRAMHPDRLPYELQVPCLERRMILGAFFGISGLLAGCAAKPVESGLTLSLRAGPDVNPDARGRPSPLSVNVLVLRSASAFEAADFFSLYERAAATLGGDLLRREEFQVRPGDSQTLLLKLPPDARAVGVVAAFRDLDRSRWRAVQPVSPVGVQSLGVTLSARSIVLDKN